MKKSTTKILLAHSSNDLYGASKILINIIELLINEGYKVYLFLPEKGPLQENDITFVIRSFILKNKIDLVYTNTSTLISPTIASKLSGIPSIFHIHEIPISSKLYTRCLATFFNIFSNKVISVSNAVSDYWVDNGLLKEKIIKIYNGFNFNFRNVKNLSKSHIVITNISRIIPYKGHLFLIELFNELSKFKNNLILNIIGDTLPEYESYYYELKVKVEQYNLTKKINFIGFQSDIKKYLEKSNFFIHCPIKPDPLPTVIFEGIESGIPIIFTNLGGSYEILDSGKNGLAIDHLSVKNSVESILEFLDNTIVQEENIKNAKSFVEKNFQMSSFNNSLKNLISKIV